MERKCQSQDRGIAETQNLLAMAMIPIINLAETFKTQFSSNPEARTLLSDALTLVGQAQFHLSVRRRYMIRPVLKKKYHSLCNISMPTTTQLFGTMFQKISSPAILLYLLEKSSIKEKDLDIPLEVGVEEANMEIPVVLLDISHIKGANVDHGITEFQKSLQLMLHQPQTIKNSRGKLCL